MCQRKGKEEKKGKKKEEEKKGKKKLQNNYGEKYIYISNVWYLVTSISLELAHKSNRLSLIWIALTFSSSNLSKFRQSDIN
jgi:hypothetical protein